MDRYFTEQESAAYVYGTRPENVIPLIAARFMGEHPAMPFVFRTFDESGIQCDVKSRYMLDFSNRLPEQAEGSYALAVADLWAPAGRKSRFVLQSDTEACVWLNGEQVCEADLAKKGERNIFPVVLKKGFNRFAILCRKTADGFDAMISNAMPQWEPCNFLMPYESRKGEAGFLYQGGLSEDDAERLLAGDALWNEEEKGMWLPSPERTPAPYAAGEGTYYYLAELNYPAVSAFFCEHCLAAWLKKSFAEVKGLVSVTVDGRTYEKDAAYECERLLPGVHTVIAKVEVCADCTGMQEGDILTDPEGLTLKLPVEVKGDCGRGLWLGPVNDAGSEKLAALAGKGVWALLATTFDGAEGPVYWKTGYPNVVVRPYVESALFGRWTYPLGVTLYGLLRSGMALDRPEYKEYVKAHVSQAASFYSYSLYDKAKYGFPGVNQQLTWLDALDDCGSFGSLILETSLRSAGKGLPMDEIRKIADNVAAYMVDEQVRRDDGAFKRRDDTMWIDDMYMSVPFLVRYSVVSGEYRYLEEAAKQLLHYQDYFLLPLDDEAALMSHMRSLDHDGANTIPWSRGNGWVIFSLSEILAVMKKDDPYFDKLAAFYNKLMKGYLKMQDETGLWHQVLDEKGTYLESSATAMFICAFVRGILDGYVDPAYKEQAAAGAYRAWKALATYIVDRYGNIYGVCQGSGFSYSREYYRTLSWNFNDTHGIGIIMLAGTELLRLEGKVSLDNN